LNRGFAWVLKSRTALFAASPLFYEEGSKYDWEKAYQINKEALEQLLKHEHALFDITPAATVAQNSYAYYHIYPAGDYSRSVDKETILANWVSYDMWLTNGLPVNKGMTSCGICPSQEMVDCYETIDGEPVLDLAQPYLDEQHLVPNYNKKNRLYDPNNPYANRDPRFEATIYYNGCPRYLVKPDSVTVWTYDGGNCSISDKAQGRFNTRTGYYLRKFNASDADEDHQTDGRAHVARLAEIYLNLAECACESGRLDEAREACNAVRNRAGMPDLPTNLNQDELRLRIRNERRVEFAFENMRFWDVRRWKIADQTDVQLTGMRITKDGSGNFSYQRFAFDPRENKSDSKYLLFPLSEDEVTKMKHNCGEDWQNPGW
ncbi:MAG: RagB/SusD family nutrient uptake outer membrane protein, partial [Bacteroidales bacterium]|nr:RagB/SusD family nutrient uptake outer membrane protein [Bacteroidales bacterium]